MEATRAELIDQPELTRSAEFKISSCSFKVISSVVNNNDGERIGTVGEWIDRTQEINVESEVAGIVNAAKSAIYQSESAWMAKTDSSKHLVSGVNDLLEVSENVVNDSVRVLGAMSQGKLTATVEVDYQGSFEQLKNNANETQAKLKTVIGEIKRGAKTLSSGALEISDGNSTLSHRTEQRASLLDQTASGMEELTSSIKVNAEQAKQ
ncbi:MAG: methyl-accepting chemotaxis protein [Gammaproteobacteria bacterium]